MDLTAQSVRFGLLSLCRGALFGTILLRWTFPAQPMLPPVISRLWFQGAGVSRDRCPIKKLTGSESSKQPPADPRYSSDYLPTIPIPNGLSSSELFVFSEPESGSLDSAQPR